MQEPELGSLAEACLLHVSAEVYSYFESRGCEREGWEEICFFGQLLKFGSVSLVRSLELPKACSTS